LFSLLNNNAQLRVEVVVVDDASTDNTAMKVAGFVEERRQKGITNPEYDILQVPSPSLFLALSSSRWRVNARWKLVAVQHNLKVGAARNLGVQASTGDVVFFCDSDDLYLEVRPIWNEVEVYIPLRC
jgi:glycosyltransferase involved in cell wall biosynthesis